MASQGHHNNTISAAQDMNQAQMTRNETHNQGQATNFLQETGTQVKTMAHSAVNIVQGAATGAANMAHGATDAVINTLGMNQQSGGGTTTGAGANHSSGGGTTNLGGSAYSAGGATNYPSSTNHPSNPS